MKALFSKKILSQMALLTGIAIFFFGCQRELYGPVFSFGCKVVQWADLDSNGSATAIFDYKFDTTNGKVLLLKYTDIPGNTTQTVVPVFSKDTVYFNTGSWAVLDNSKRIYRLEERNAVNASAPNGSYYYTYDASGHIASRTYDDGAVAQTTTYSFTGDELTTANEPAMGSGNALTVSYTYSSTATVTDYNTYIIASRFPELRLYMPCFSFGRFTNKALEKTAIKLNIPFLPIPEITTTYSSYQFDSKGYVTKVRLDNRLGTTPVSKSFLSAVYFCK